MANIPPSNISSTASAIKQMQEWENQRMKVMLDENKTTMHSLMQQIFSWKTKAEIELREHEEMEERVIASKERVATLFS